MAIYFIGDLHFDDKNINDFANRNFSSVKNMNNYMAEEWNSIIHKDDKVYIVGDFVDKNYSVETADLISKLQGHKFLIRGNHDTLSDDEYYELGIEKVYDNPIILQNFYIISHEPMFMNETMPYVNIFAHVHNNSMYKDYGKHHFCVSVERPEMCYKPIPFSKIKEIIEGEYK